MSILIVVAHPDDEVLRVRRNCGSLRIAGQRAVFQLHPFRRCRRTKRSSRSVRISFEYKRGSKILGYQEPILGGFPNIRFNAVPHLELVQFIESSIIQTQADIIFLPTIPATSADDHKQTSAAAGLRPRLFQRRAGIVVAPRTVFHGDPLGDGLDFPSSDAFRADTFLRNW